MPKIKYKGTPDEIMTLLEALRHSPLVTRASADEITKYAATDRWGTAWIEVTFRKTIRNNLPITIYERRRKRGRSGPRDHAGYVYLLSAPGLPGLYKIGKTVNIKSRRKTFNVKLPFEAEFAHTIRTDDKDRLEKLLHRRFADKRERGEFFRLTEDDVAFIVGLGASCTIAEYQAKVSE